MRKMFVGHGAPTHMFANNKFTRDLATFSKSIDKPNKIIVFSAHWQEYLPIQITSNSDNFLFYDYYGFPEEYYKVKYNAPGDPKLASKIATEFKQSGIDTTLTEKRGLDHGTFMPLKILYPNADIPVIQISIPYPREIEYLNKMGKIITNLGDKTNEDILLIGSGNITHNLRLVQQDMIKYRNKVPNHDWAIEFDKSIKEIMDTDTSKLNNIQNNKNFNLAAPTSEHFDPLHFINGAIKENEGIKTIHESIDMGSISMRTFITE